MEYHDGGQLRHVGTLPTMVAHRYGDKPAIIDQGKTFSYADLETRTNRAANVFADHGVEAGDRVALYLPNTFQFPETFFGAIKAGAIPVALNLRMDEDTLVYILEDAEIDHLVSSPLLLHGLETERASVVASTEIAEAAGVGKHYVPGIDQDGVIDYEAAREAASDAFDRVDRAFDDVVIQTYTSGTTGKPKGVLLTHENVIRTLEGMSRTAAGAVDPDDSVLLVLPMFHIPTMFAVFGTHVYRGATVVMQAIPDPAAMLSAVDEHGITTLPAVPALHTMMWREYRDNPDVYDLSSLEVLGAGAAPLPEDTQNSLIEAWGASFNEVWGMTETTSVATIRPATAPKPAGCIGKPIRNVEIRLIDSETREPVVDEDEINPYKGPINQELPFDNHAAVSGEIAIRGPTIFEGYHGLPEKNAQVFDGEGWFYTGDIARVDEDGDLWIVDRADDMIIAGGENVYPTEVEDALYAHPDIAEAAVVAAPHEVKGEAPVAFVVPETDSELTEQAVREFTLEHVATYAHPRRVFFVDELPRSATQKVQRFKLEEEAKARLDGALEPSERL